MILQLRAQSVEGDKHPTLSCGTRLTFPFTFMCAQIPNLITILITTITRKKKTIFLPRDAMQSTAKPSVSIYVCPSVFPFFRSSYSCVTLKRLKITSNALLVLLTPSSLTFSARPALQNSRRNPPAKALNTRNEGKKFANFWPIYRHNFGSAQDKPRSLCNANMKS